MQVAGPGAGHLATGSFFWETIDGRQFQTAEAYRSWRHARSLPAAGGKMQLIYSLAICAIVVGGASAYATPAVADNYYVQVTSQRSEGEALAAFRSLQAKYPSQLSGREVAIHKLDLGAQGTYYRGMVGPFTNGNEASDLCSSLNAVGAHCLVQVQQTQARGSGTQSRTRSKLQTGTGTPRATDQEIRDAASPSTCWLKDDGCRAYIGKRLWVAIPAGNQNVVEVTFTRGDWTTSRTLKLKTGASFVVTDLAKGTAGSVDYVVRLDDGRIGWVSNLNSIFLLDYDPVARAKAAQEECTRRGQPKIGMSRDELVETCWRKPARIVKKTTAAGVEENYIYGLGHAAKLIDGKVTEILEAR